METDWLKLKFNLTRRALAFGVTFLLSIGLLTAIAPVQTASALSVDMSGVELDFSSVKRTSSSTPTANNGTATCTNVATVSGIQIDALVTTTISSATVDNYDNPGSASANEKYFQINNTASAVGGFTSFKFQFYDHSDGSPVVLKNVLVTSIDLDSPGRQFTEFSAFQNYTLSSTTNLVAYTTDQAGASLPNGLVRFTPNRTQTPGSNNNVAADAVQVTFNELSEYVAKFGNEQAAAGYFGVSFKGI